MRKKRRPTLDELRALPVDLWRLEVAQLEIEIATSDCAGLEQEAAELFDDPEITPEKVIALREAFERATGSTDEFAGVQLDAAVIPCPAEMEALAS